MEASLPVIHESHLGIKCLANIIRAEDDELLMLNYEGPMRLKTDKFRRDPTINAICNTLSEFHDN